MERTVFFSFLDPKRVKKRLYELHGLHGSWTHVGKVTCPVCSIFDDGMGNKGRRSIEKWGEVKQENILSRFTNQEDALPTEC